MTPILLTLLAYLVGATPTSFWVGRWFFGTDLREHGSGNLGATNVLRTLGIKAAIPVVLVDVGKGWLPVWLFSQLHGDAPFAWALAYGVAAILGHVFSFWVGFSGGKGVATSGGVFLALSPWAVLVGAGVFFAVALPTRIASLGSLSAAAALPAAVWLLPHRGGARTLWFTFLLAAFVFWSHRSNIRRLLRGEENRFGEDGAPSGARRTVAEDADPTLEGT